MNDFFFLSLISILFKKSLYYFYEEKKVDVIKNHEHLI